MKEIKAPNSYDVEAQGKVVLFTAGSIELGKAEDWQNRLVKELSGLDNLLILNPRRNDWDASWKQEKTFAPFREQVEWELQAQEDADVIAMYFSPETKSPITLLELGLFCTEKLVVFCPEGFWRKGNVDIVCERYNVTQADSWEHFVQDLKRKIENTENRKLTGVW